MSKLLVVDDEKQFIKGLKIALEKSGFSVDGADNADDFMQKIKTNSYSTVITDLKMPEIDGLKVIDTVKKYHPDTPVIMATAFGTVKSAINAMKKGAYDYIIKPFQIEELLLTVRNAVELYELKTRNKQLEKSISAGDIYQGMSGKSKGMKEIFSIIEKVKDTGSTVLILGESGTGKELAARALHYGGAFKEKPFIAVNCGAIPATLLESELFGHEKGSFTGAYQQREGYLEKAHGGTLFLDEIAELPMELQVKFLRVLEGAEFTKVGSTKPVKVKIRLVTATNKNIEKLVNEGKFREDLYFRINVISIKMPALRERKEDIPYLVNHFLNKFTLSFNKEKLEITLEALERLMSFSWPGNVRELENVLERAVVLSRDDKIKVCDLPEKICSRYAPGSSEKSRSLKSLMDEFEKEVILNTLQKFNYNQLKTAEHLKTVRQNIQYKIKKHKIHIPRRKD